MTNWPKIRLLEARLHWWRSKYEYRNRVLSEYVGEGAEQQAALPEPQDALKIAEEGVKKWGPLTGEAAKEVHALADAIHKLRPAPVGPQGEGWTVPATSWNPYRRKIANWITRELIWAHAHGWNGVVTSGVRTYAEQARLYEIYQHGGNIAARPGQSNHEGYDYPRGAIDTPQAEQLNHVLNGHSGRKLLWAETHGLSDFVHFSGTGR